MNLIRLLLAVALMASAADAQLLRRFRKQTYAPPKVDAKKKPMVEVDANEVKRWGNIVQRVGPGVWSDPGVNTFGDAMSTPPSEKHKWFISVVVDGSPESKRLEQDFNTDSNLKIWANPSDHKQSWSHYRVYSIADTSQAFRFKNLSLQGFPTVLIQPPLTNQFGNPRAVVGQIYCKDGDCKKLSKDIRSSIGRYIKTQQQRQAAPRPIPAKKPEPKVWTAPAKPKNGGWGQIEPPIPEGAIGQEPVERWRPGPAPFNPTPNGPVRPNILPNLPSVLPPQLLPPSDDDSQNPNDSEYSEGPEAIIITDAATGLSEDNNRRIRSLVRGLRRDRFKNLRERYMDLPDARRRGIPVTQEDLPAVVLTNRSRIFDKISAALLPNISLDPTAPPSISDLPWESLISLFLGNGIGFAAIASIGIWGIRWFRRRRKMQGQEPIVSDDLFQMIVSAVPGFAQKAEEWLTKRNDPKKKPQEQ